MRSFAVHIKRVSLAAMLLSSFIGVGGAYAAGTNAGQTISNTATVSYSVNSVAQPSVTSSPATFVVDRKIDMSMTPAGTTTQPNATGVAVSYVVLNEGNAPDSFTLHYAFVSGVDVSATMQLYFDTDNSGTYNAGDTLVPNDTVVPFALDEQRRYFVVTTIPGTATNGQSSLVSLTATTTTPATPPGPDNPAVVEVVYAEGLGPTYDGAISATATYAITSAALTLSKAVQVISDPTGNTAPNAKAIPGALVQYTITATNSPTAGLSATNITLTDAIPVTTTYQAGTIGKAGGTAPAPTDANVVGNALSVPVGTLAVGGTASVTFRVVIN
jgi:uncharacterized repeat protein (TIGR01451 family)